MTKTIKMSLVAAMAVTAFSSTASAGSLEEAIKGVSISGKMEVEYDYTDTNTGVAGAPDMTSNDWDLDWDVTAKIPVNDNITAVFGAEGDTAPNADNGVITGKGNVQVTKVYFQYANGPVTAMVGKQGIGAPWFDDERATGVKALATVGPVTLAAAHFTATNANADGAVALNQTDISAAAAIGSFGPINASLWYANLSGIVPGLDADSYSLNVNGKFDIVNVDLTHTSTDYDVNGVAVDPEAELTKLVVSADFGVAVPYVGYGMTNDELVATRSVGVDLTNDNDASVNFGTEQLFIDDLNDADAILVGVTVPFGDWKFDLSYVDGEYSPAVATDYDFNELLLDVEYKMSKNFTIDMFYSTAELQTGAAVTAEMDSASIALEYKF